MTTTPPTPVAPTEPAPPPAAAAALATVTQLTVSDVLARIHKVLVDEYEMAEDEVTRLESFVRFQIGGDTWRVGHTVPNADSMHILAMFRGAKNDHTAETLPGDIRVYTVPLTVVKDDKSKAYGRITVNPAMQRVLTEFMVMDQFIEAVSYEWYSSAFAVGILEEDES